MSELFERIILCAFFAYVSFSTGISTAAIFKTYGANEFETGVAFATSGIGAAIVFTRIIPAIARAKGGE